jgi:UDP-N-acetylmuramate dehydrogenase
VLTTEEARARLAQIPDLAVSTDTALSEHTRFGIGGPADLFAETSSAEAFVQALAAARVSGLPTVVMGGGTNLVVSDDGFRGIVLRFRGSRLMAANCRVIADAGADLQALIDFGITRGLKGLETLAGIPGSVGAAVYGNAGAYGHSISERVVKVRFFDGEQVRVFTKKECDFRYRESVFKLHKEWIIFSVELLLEPANAAGLRQVADDILRVRNQKFPVTMKCAGSIFKNLLLDELPASVAAQVPDSVVRERKVPAAYFLEQVGAKGMRRGDIHVASYHANLIYNGGAGTAADLCALIEELKSCVFKRFGIEFEEEVQYVGFAPEVAAAREPD